MRSRKLNKTRMILILILCAVTLGFALLFSDLKINGIGHILAPKWDIHWDSNSVAVSSKSVDGEVEVNDKEDEVDFTANLHVPGDVYEFSIDAVNEGTIDGMITLVTTTFYNENDEEIERPYYIDFDITDDEDNQLSPYQELNANTSKTYKVRLSYSRNINNEDLPINPKQFKTRISIDYQKKDDRSTTVEPYVRNLCNNTLVYSETTTFKANKVEDLVCLSQKVNSGTNFSGKTINLEKNIDFTNRDNYVKSRDTSYGDINGNGKIEELLTELTTEKGFKPIGTNNKPFQGTFIGNMNTIQNLTIIRPNENYIGLFGYNYGIIKQLKLNNIEINGNNYVGGLAGQNYSGTIQTIEATGIEVEGNDNVGGILGDNSNGLVTEIKFDTKVTGNNYVGGIVGEGSISNAVGRTEVNGTGSYGVGGAVGSSGGKISGVIIESGHCNKDRFDGATSGTVHDNNMYYLDGYTGTNSKGMEIDNSERNVSAYDNAIDTWIGGDNDDTGYYFTFDENGEPQLTKVEAEPITFTLEGSGTEEDPYLIHNPKEWNEATTKAQQTGINFKIANDIDFSEKEFYKLGSTKNTFKGTLDGNNKTLRGIELKGGAYQGIVGYATNTAVIKDLKVENSKVLKATYSGMIAGYNNGLIKHITADNIKVTGSNYIGGLAGQNYSGTIQTIEATGIEVEGNDYVGGILGDRYNTNAILNEIKFDTKVTGNNYVGGIVGEGSISNAVGRTEVNGTGNYGVGGAVGSSGGKISGVIIESGHCNKDRFDGATSGTVHDNNMYYLDGYTGTNSKGMEIDNSERNVSAYDNAIDTWIGGDNDDTGYYFTFDENGEPQLTKVEAEPITFTLEGSGTEEDPYLIHNPKEWNEATTKAQQTGINFKIANDIDFSEKEFYKLGSTKNTFKGTLDGNNKTLRGIELKGGAYQGIVGYATNTAVIKDLKVENSKVLKATYSGMIAGYNNGLIKHITADNIKVTGSNYIGGLAGQNYSGTIQTIEATGIEVEGNDYVGGILGDRYNTNAILNEIKFDTKVTGNNYVGGIVGEGSISNAVGRTEVNGTGNYGVGGAVGSSGGKISGVIIESGHCNKDRFDGATSGTVHDNNMYYLDGYTGTNSKGMEIDNSERNVSAYDNAIDTWIGGDNDDTGYYFTFDENGEPQLTKVEAEPITFTLEGSGTEEDPYLIHNPKEWNEATTKAQQTGINFKIANDIDFSEKEFYKLGSTKNTFKGTLDGNNKTLRGIELKGGAYQGIVGYATNTAVIKDLKVENSKVLKATYSGMIAGYNNGLIKHITADNIKVTGSNYIGGLAGQNYSGTIQTIEATGIEVEGNDYVGGILGDRYNTNAILNEIKFDTKVTGNNYVGGIVGEGSISNAVGRTEVNGTGSYGVGGAVGSSGGKISGVIIESGHCNKDRFDGATGGTVYNNNMYYIEGYTAATSQGTQWPTSYLHDLEQYSQVVETPITGDTDGSGYVFDYILGDGEIHLVPVQDYSGWKLMNNKIPMTSQKWSYYDSNHERIQSGWHELPDLYNEQQYYYFENGYAKSGWLELDGKKYYLSTFDPDGNGYMDCNRIHDTSIMIGEELYTFDSDGVCTNCTN